MRRFLRYLVTAGTASVADLTVAQSLLFIESLQSGLMFAVPVICGALAGMGVNFTLSRAFVFELDQRSPAAQMQSFFVISCTILVLKVVVSFLLLAGLTFVIGHWLAQLPVDGAAGRLAQFGSMGVVAIYSFLAHKHISFDGGVRAFVKRRLAR